MIIDDLIKTLELNKNIFTQFIEQMEEMEINNRIKDYWTIYEHIDHLTFCQKMLLHRIKQFVMENNPVIVPYIPENDTEQVSKKSVNDLLKEYCQLRDEQINIIKNVEKNIWLKQAKHEEYKKYTFEILIRHILLHDSWHMYRIEELWIGKEEYIKELK